MELFFLGVAVVVGAVALLGYALLASPVQRVDRARRSHAAASPESSTREATLALVDGVDRLLRSRNWVPLSAVELELAGIRKPVGLVATWIVGGAAVALLIGSGLLRSPFTGLALALLVGVAAKVVIRVLTSRRRAAFAKQLDPTLRIIASALRAGQSLPMAISSVAQDAEPPMAEELGRITNEARVGRDLVTAMHESSVRMANEDLRWFAEAVEVQRDTGGNLNDIIDVVAETIRERSEIRQKVDANAAEGKTSAWVLMALPIVLAVIFSVIRPGYFTPMLDSLAGKVLFILSGVFYLLGYLWMRAIVNIKV